MNLAGMKTILAIDQSTSATKAVLFDTQGKVLARVAREHKQIYPSPGWVEHNPEEIWENTVYVSRELKATHPEAFKELLCVSITNQRETVVVFEKGTGRPLYNALVWQCRRGQAICERLKQAGYDEILRRKTGLAIDTYFSAPKLRWLIENEREISDALKSGRALIGTIDTYLIYRLTKCKVFATDFTNASRTLLLNVVNLQWDKELCEMFKVPLASLPEVRESACTFGETDIDGILSHPVPICGVMGDSQAALFAQQCYQPGTGKATFGTGTSILVNIGSEFRLSRSGAVTALAWVLDKEPTYAFEGLINYSAATIEWLRNQLSLINSAAEVEALATEVPDNGGVYLVPAFTGLNAPYNAPLARAAILGMTPATRRSHIVRAALEAIAYQIRDVIEMMESEGNLKLSVLNCDGGPTKNRFLMQFVADIVGLELLVSELAEASALGAAMNGMLGLGIYPDIKSLEAIKVSGTIYRRKMDSVAADRLYAGWLDAVARLIK
jgi:glycerol kinase